MRRPVPLLLAGSVAVASVLGLAAGPVRATSPAPAPPDQVVVRVAQVVAVGEPTTAVVAGPVGSDLVGRPFQVLDAAGTVVARGTLVAPPETARGRPVDPAPFGEVALAQVPALDAEGDVVVRAAGAAGALAVRAAPYDAFVGGLLDLYDWNADGRDSTVHAPSHLHDKTATIANGPLRGTTANLLGGWMDAGDQVKFTLTIAHAAVLLELALYEAQDPTLRAALQHQADVGARYLRRTHPSPDLFVSLVGAVETDHDTGFRDPSSDDASSTPRIAHRPAYAFTKRSGGADAAGMTATALALAAGRSTGRAAARLATAAEEWLALAQRLRRPWANDYYPTDTWLDDVAMAQLAVASIRADRSLAEAGAATLEQALAPGGDVHGWQVQVDGYDMGAVPAAMLCGVLPVEVSTLVPPASSARGCDLLAAGVRDAEFRSSLDPFGLPAATTWGTTRQVGSAVAVALLADRAGDDAALETARRGWAWFLGANPWGTRFQAGYGVAHSYHWSQVLPGDQGDLGDPRPPGAVVGGPAPVADLASVSGAPAYEPGPFDTDEVGWRDEPLDYVSNEVGLGYQSPWVLAGVLAAR